MLYTYCKRGSSEIRKHVRELGRKKSFSFNFSALRKTIRIRYVYLYQLHYTHIYIYIYIHTYIYKERKICRNGTMIRKSLGSRGGDDYDDGDDDNHGKGLDGVEIKNITRRWRSMAG